MDEIEIADLEKTRFRSGLAAIVLLCVSVGTIPFAQVESINDIFLICVGAASIVAMLFSLAARETAQRKLSDHWQTVLGGTTWRTVAGETVSAIGADDTGRRITGRFLDGYISSFWTSELEIVTKGITFRKDDYFSDGNKLLAETGKRRWKTEDGRVGIVRNYEIHHAEDSGSQTKYLVLRLNDGNTESFNLDRLVAV